MKKKIIVLISVVFLILMGLYMGGRPGRIILLSLTVLGLFELIYALAMPKRVSPVFVSPSYIRKGKKLKIKISIPYYSALPVLSCSVKLKIRHLYFPDNQKEEYQVVLRGRRLRGEISFIPEVMGLVTAELLTIEFSGVLGIWSRRIRENLKREIMILPAFDEGAVVTEPLKPSMIVGEEEIASIKGRDMTSFSGVRPYRQGDNLRQIHWKLTGKFDDYLVKEPDEPAKKIPVLFLETRMDKADAGSVDSLLEQYLAISASLSDEGFVHVLAFKQSRDGDFYFHKVAGTEDLDEVYDILFRVEFYDNGMSAVSFFPDDTLFSEMIYVTDFWMGQENLPDRLMITVVRHPSKEGGKHGSFH